MIVKKKIMIILLAITIGGVLAFFTLSRIERKNKTENVITLTVLQTGVFSDYENAVEQKESMNNAIIL